MAYALAELRISSGAESSHTLSTRLRGFGSSIAEALHRRWIYQRTRAELQGYSEHTLRDLGADRGIDEFARRAAGF